MNKIRGVRQVGGTTCGQACVAMIAGISLADSIKVFGHSHKTRTKDLIAALRTLGFRTDSKLHPAPRVHKSGWASKVVSIFHVKWANQAGGHWVVNNYGQILDPMIGHVFDNLDLFEEHLKLYCGRVVSGLAIRNYADIVHKVPL